MRVSRVKRAFCLVFAVMLILGSLTVPASADDTTTTGGAETSFYKLSSVASTWFADSMARTDGISTLNGLFKGANAGNVGGLLGYADEINDSGLIQGWIASALSMSSATISYSSFGEDSNSVTQALKHYSNYGRVLRLYGFDGMATEGGNVVRVVAGGLIKIAYWLSLSVEFIFNGVIKLLQIMNPFRFVMPADGIYQIPQTQTDAMGDSYEFYHEAAAGGALYELSKFLGGMYAQFQEFGVTFMIPFLLFVLISSILLTKDSGSVKHKIFVYVRRAVIIVMGVPICTSIYTTMLNQLALDISANQGAAQRIILSTFLDFESWAETTRLKMPMTIADDGTSSADGWLWLDTRTGSVGGASIPHLRDTCYAINMASWTARKYFGSGAIAWSGGDTMNSGTGGLGAALKYTEDTLPGTATSDAKLNDASVTQIGNLIDRYMGNECYHSGDFESYVKSQLNVSGGTDTTYKMLTESPPTKVSEFKEHTDEYFGSTANELWNNGGLLSKQSAGTGTILYSRAEGLSTMSMYNYLSTKFDASSMTVYSNEKASSGLVRPSHLSVNLIGTTVVDKFLNWARALMMLLTVAVIGWFYGFSMIMSSVKRSIMTIMHIPFVAMGGLKSTARVVLQMTLMIIEVVATIIAYRVMAEIALSLDNLFGNVFLQAFTKAGILTVTGAVWNVFTILLIVTNVLFLIVALKLRKSIVKSFDEQAKELIDRLFGVNSGPTGNEGPGMGARLAGAAAAGAGAGLAHKMMSGGGGEGNVRGVSGSDDSRPPMPPLNTDPPGGGEDERNALAGEDARALPSGGEGPGESGPDDGSSPGGGASFDSESGGSDESEGAEFKSRVDGAESLDDLGGEGASGAAAVAAASDDDSESGGEGSGSDEGGEPGDESGDERDVAPGDAAGDDASTDAGDDGDERPVAPGDAGDGASPDGEARGGGSAGARGVKPGDEGSARRSGAGASGSSSGSKSDSKSRRGGAAASGGRAGDKPGSEVKSGATSGESAGKSGAKPGSDGDVRRARPADAGAGRRGDKPGSGSGSGEGRKPGEAVRRAEAAAAAVGGFDGASPARSGAESDARRVAPAESGENGRSGASVGSASGVGATSGSRPGEAAPGSSAGSGASEGRGPRPSADGARPGGDGRGSSTASGFVEEARARRDALAAQRDALAAQLGVSPGAGVSSGSGGDAVPRGVAPDGGSRASGSEPATGSSGAAGDGPTSGSVGVESESRGVAPGAASGGSDPGRASEGARGVPSPGRSATGGATPGANSPAAPGPSGSGSDAGDGVRAARSETAGGAGPTGVIPGSGRQGSTSGPVSAAGGGREAAGRRGEFGGESGRQAGDEPVSTGSPESRREAPGSSHAAPSAPNSGGSTTVTTTTTTRRSSEGKPGPSASRVAAMAAASSLLAGSDNPILRGAGQGVGMATQAHVFGSARRGGSEETTTTTTRTERRASSDRRHESAAPAGEESIESYDAESEQLRMQIENLQRRQAEERGRAGERRRDGSAPRKSLRRKS